MLQKKTTIFAFLATMLSFNTIPISCIDNQYWDWNTFNTKNIHVPKNFLFGVATSSYQVEGGNTNAWDNDAQAGFSATPAGIACDHWNRYKQDIECIKELGANAYRFSVEWSRIQPTKDYFNESALDHYERICDELLAHGIAPVITLHHYNDPIWFAELGGFEKTENIKYYVDFAKKVVDRLHTKVHLWLTFNSAASYAAKGYLQAMMPPRKKNMQLMAEVLKNVLEAHVQLYSKVKNDSRCATAQIGILHNILQLDPARPWHPVDIIATHIGNYITNRVVYQFFTTGEFSFKIPCGLLPFQACVHHINHLAPRSLDFIGLNYYSHARMHGTTAIPYNEEIKTSAPQYTIYPEGFYKAIKEISREIAEPLTIPIFITENGIAPIQEEDRELFLQRYLFAMSQAIKDGCNVQGYFYWSLMDNYEWDQQEYGEKRYGLYHVDFETQKRTIKTSAQPFIDFATTCVQPFHVNNLHILSNKKDDGCALTRIVKQPTYTVFGMTPANIACLAICLAGSYAGYTIVKNIYLNTAHNG